MRKTFNFFDSWRNNKIRVTGTEWEEHKKTHVLEHFIHLAHTELANKTVLISNAIWSSNASNKQIGDARLVRIISARETKKVMSPPPCNSVLCLAHTIHTVGGDEVGGSFVAILPETTIAIIETRKQKVLYGLLGLWNKNYQLTRRINL